MVNFMMSDNLIGTNAHSVSGSLSYFGHYLGNLSIIKIINHRTWIIRVLALCIWEAFLFLFFIVHAAHTH